MKISDAKNLVKDFEHAVARRELTSGKLKIEWEGKAEATRKRILDAMTAGGGATERPSVKGPFLLSPFHIKTKIVNGRHPCLARDCTEPIDQKFVLCVGHWSKLSDQLKAELKEAYRSNAGDVGVNPGERFLEVARRAIEVASR